MKELGWYWISKYLYHFSFPLNLYLLQYTTNRCLKHMFQNKIVLFFFTNFGQFAQLSKSSKLVSFDRRLIQFILCIVRQFTCEKFSFLFCTDLHTIVLKCTVLWEEITSLCPDIVQIVRGGTPLDLVLKR